jgi:hypothetical protein
MCSRFLISVCLALFAVVVVASCSGQNTVPFSPPPVNSQPMQVAQTVTPQPSGSARVLPRTNASPGCPLIAGGGHFHVLCGNPPPSPSPTPKPSPTPTPTPTPSPSPTPAPAVGSVQLANPGSSYWGYIVTTTTPRTYYFPPNSAATYNSSTQQLIIRGYLETFIWPVSKVESLQNFGNTISPQSLGSETMHPLIDGLDDQEDCDVDPADCQQCPDCSIDPDNPDGCQYGTDPLTGGCIGSAGIELVFTTPGYLAYCVEPYSIACFAYEFAAICGGIELSPKG